MHKYSKNQREGHEAYIEGKPATANPYKGERKVGNNVYGATSQYSFWAYGWQQAAMKDS